MAKSLSAALFLSILSIATLSAAAGKRPTASRLLGQVQARYEKMQSYSSSGEITESVSTPKIGHQVAHYTFSIRLARPRLYRIEWEQHMSNMTARGAVWSAGNGNYLMVPGEASPSRPKDISMALDGAMGVSGGAASTIPCIFFGLSCDELKSIRDATFGADADIGGTPCYVVTAKLGRAKLGKIKETIWISKKSMLVQQIRSDLNGLKFPKITDDEARKTLRGMGKVPTAAAIKRLKAQLAFMRSMTSGAKGFFVQVQRQIVVNATLTKADFAPQGAPAKKSKSP